MKKREIICKICRGRFENEKDYNEHLFVDGKEECLFKCEKNDWYSEVDKIKKWDKEKVKKFWEKIRAVKMAKNDCDFSHFIFPKFEEYDPNLDLEESRRIKLENGDATVIYKTKKGKRFNFWEEDRELNFIQVVDFNRSIFRDKANFATAIFDNEANFEAAAFDNVAFFVASTFSDNANFEAATFSDNANFYGAIFDNEAYFFGAIFDNEAYFSVATFNNDAIFGEATFSNNANFYGATFSNNANFAKAIFSNEANFWGAKFSGESYFTYLNGIPNLIFHGVDFGKSKRFLFDDCNLSLGEFSKNSGLEKIEINGCEFKSFEEKKKEKGARVFENSKRDFDLLKTIAQNSNLTTEQKNEFIKKYDEEIKNLEKKLKTVKGREEKIKRYKENERIYIQLKKNFEDRNDFNSASEFHIGEKESRKKWLKMESDKKFSNFVDTAKGFFDWFRFSILCIFWPPRWKMFLNKSNLELFFLVLYEKTSLYGEEPKRAFGIIRKSFLILASIFFIVLITGKESGSFLSLQCAPWKNDCKISQKSFVEETLIVSRNVFESFNYSLRSLTFQKTETFESEKMLTSDNNEELFRWVYLLGRITASAGHVLGAIFIPLFLLALRRKFKR